MWTWPCARFHNVDIAGSYCNSVVVRSAGSATSSSRHMTSARSTFEAHHGLHPARLLGIRAETPTLVSLQLAIDEFEFSPGQSLMLDWGFGPMEAPISSDPLDAPEVRVTLRADLLPPRAAMRGAPKAAGPCGSEWPVMELLGHDVLLVGYEIGLATLLPLVRELARFHESFQRITLVAGGRDAASVPFRADLETLAAQHGVHVHIADDPQAADGGLPEAAEESLIVSGRSALACIAASTRLATDVMDRLRLRGLGTDLMHIASACHWHCQAGECGRCNHGPNEVDRVGAIQRADRWRPADVPRVVHQRAAQG